jgi:hypothetical protein
MQENYALHAMSFVYPLLLVLIKIDFFPINCACDSYFC